MNSTQRSEREQETHEAFTDPDWWEKRREGIGGSDAAAVLGVHPFMTPRKLWREIKGIDGPSDPDGNMRRGTVLEPVAAGEYERRTGRKVRRQPQRSHPEHDFIRGNIDRQILSGSGEGDWKIDETALLEIFCPQIHSFGRVRAQGVPEYKVVQIQHYLAVFGYGLGSYGVFNSDLWHLIPIDVHRDSDFIKGLIQREVYWWRTYVEGDTPPPEEAADARDELDIPEVEGEVVVLTDPDVIEVAEQFVDMRGVRKEAQELEKMAKKQLQSELEKIGLGAFEIQYPDEAKRHRFYLQERGRDYFQKDRVAEVFPVALERVMDVVERFADEHGDGLPEEQADELKDRLRAHALDLAGDRWYKRSSWTQLQPFPHLELDR